MNTNHPEHWLRGPVEGVPPMLQPVAHALRQAVDEVRELMLDFPDSLLWKRPAGVASPGFHLQHITGVVDRLTTYAQGRSLSPEQLSYLQGETAECPVGGQQLVQQWAAKVEEVITLLKQTKESSLTQHRPVGRKALPSTALGLLFHAAEHTMRHVGQLSVTVKVLKAGTEL